MPICAFFCIYKSIERHSNQVSRRKKLITPKSHVCLYPSAKRALFHAS